MCLSPSIVHNFICIPTLEQACPFLQKCSLCAIEQKILYEYQKFLICFMHFYLKSYCMSALFKLVQAFLKAFENTALFSVYQAFRYELQPPGWLGKDTNCWQFLTNKSHQFISVCLAKGTLYPYKPFWVIGILRSTLAVDDLYTFCSRAFVEVETNENLQFIRLSLFRNCHVHITSRKIDNHETLIAVKLRNKVKIWRKSTSFNMRHPLSIILR